MGSQEQSISRSSDSTATSTDEKPSGIQNFLHSIQRGASNAGHAISAEAKALNTPHNRQTATTIGEKVFEFGTPLGHAGLIAERTGIIPKGTMEHTIEGAVHTVGDKTPVKHTTHATQPAESISVPQKTAIKHRPTINDFLLPTTSIHDGATEVTNSKK